MIGIVNKKTVITNPYVGFPAERGGLRVGDEIVSVDGKNVQGKPTSEVSALLKGKPKTAGVDPYNILIDRIPDDNTGAVE